MGNIVAIVGRPNVGKSTLFNRLTESRRAIVDDSSGVTRDRIYGKSTWNGMDFSVIDTGGYVQGSDDIFEGEIRKQVELAIDESDLIVFVVDVNSGVTAYDNSVAQLLRRSKKDVIVAVNKTDNTAQHMDVPEFYSMGLPDLYPISSANGSGTGDILDAIVEKLPDLEEEDLTGIPRFTIVGRPNVGKSSTINTLLGEERHLVTDVAGTTRDAVSTRYTQFGYDFMLVDTAGLRKKKNVVEDIEFYSVLRSVRSIENCDVCLLILDATRGIESQDVNIFHLIQRNHKGIVVMVNKWDLVEKVTSTTKEFEDKIKEKFAPFVDIPIVFTSAVTKQRIFKAIEEAVAVSERRRTRISTSKLNDFLLPITDWNPPPSHKGKFIKIKYVTQLPTYYPTFALYCNLPQYIKDPYRRFIENKLREEYNLTGVPIQIFFRKK